MWPFKKKPPPLSPEEWANQFPPAPCGEQRLHYEWEKINGMTCPRCHYLEKERVRIARQREFADAIADSIVRKLGATQTPFK